jgi:hypothetical protein
MKNKSRNRASSLPNQAAIAALSHAQMGPRSGLTWGHAFVQAAFVGQLIN